MELFWVLGLIGLFLLGTFLYTWRLLKRLSRREEAVDPEKLRVWDDDQD